MSGNPPGKGKCGMADFTARAAIPRAFIIHALELIIQTRPLRILATINGEIRRWLATTLRWMDLSRASMS